MTTATVSHAEAIGRPSEIFAHDEYRRGLNSSAAASPASFTIRTRDRFGNVRTAGGEPRPTAALPAENPCRSCKLLTRVLAWRRGTGDELRLNFQLERIKPLPFFWADRCGAGIECPEVHTIFDYGNGSYMLVSSHGPTAALPMDNPCCSCKLTRVRRLRTTISSRPTFTTFPSGATTAARRSSSQTGE